MQDPIDPEKILNWPVTIIKATKEDIILRDHSGAEIRISANELTYERIW